MNYKIKKNGQIRINGEVPDYSLLVANFEKVENFQTAECGELDLFKCGEGYIEYLGDTCFIHGESANFTTCSLEEIKEAYGVEED